MKVYTADKATGSFIEAFDSVADARKAIVAYEEEDKANDRFEKDFYDVVDEDHYSLDSLGDEFYCIDFIESQLNYLKSYPVRKSDDYIKGQIIGMIKAFKFSCYIPKENTEVLDYFLNKI